MKRANKYWIIGIFLVVLALIIFGRHRNARFDAEMAGKRFTRHCLREIDIKMTTFVESQKRWPRDIDEFIQFFESDDSQDSVTEPSMDIYTGNMDLHSDGWGNTIILRPVSKGKSKLISIISKGPNGKIDDDDDMIRWWPIEFKYADPTYESPYDLSAGK